MLIAGLGNPGPEYSATRHNIGSMVLDKLADSLALSFNDKKSMSGMIARGKTSEGKELILLKPNTFMNESGFSVSKTIKYYNLSHQNLIVIADDIDLPFGTIRARLKSGNAGHKGLKSIEQSLGNSLFSRVKMGIANDHLHALKAQKAREALKDYVLSGFTAEERKLLPEFISAGAKIILQFMNSRLSLTFSMDKIILK